ncbi:S-methyl-5-thioribose-1-phosphate isomerase, partial [Desulfovibrio sp. OttesenSCG-928-F20]|nr:S-methyl-5-thioribose-1-phosphate isomerase [Desulfovibrio sp. OttesenSCG-928-F20]
MQDHIRFDDESFALMLLDQRLLPGVEKYYACRSVADVIFALREMVVRGAPAIGVTAAWGCVLGVGEIKAGGQSGPDQWVPALDALLDDLAGARPTAVNLAWAVNRMRALWQKSAPMSQDELLTLWKAEAAHMQSEDVAINRRMGAHGAALLDSGDTVLTHCNAGALATAGFGTALGLVYAAVEQGKDIEVIADETRPFLQG